MNYEIELKESSVTLPFYYFQSFDFVFLVINKKFSFNSRLLNFIFFKYILFFSGLYQILLSKYFYDYLSIVFLS
jgi:hypothetical protein